MLIVLGQTNDDKGTQLEELVLDLLVARGYQNTRVNAIRSGGEELDVVGEFAFPSPGGPQPRRLICECKAYRRVVDMPDWLKFLGKIYVEQRSLNQEVFGCFIALSGVNGNVSGQFDHLKRQGDGVTLLTGDDLLPILTKKYELCALDVVVGRLKATTSRTYKSIDQAYYRRAMYWLVTFEDEAFTVLGADGNPVEGEILETVKECAQGALAAHDYIDLAKEQEAARRADILEKLVLTALFGGAGKTKLEILREAFTDYNETEIVGACERLKGKSWTTWSAPDDEITLNFPPAGSENETVADVFRFFLTGPVVVDAIGSPFYDAHVNESLVKHMQRIQGDLALTEEQIDAVVKITRLSPGALALALIPQGMIVNHRRDPNENLEARKVFEKEDANYFVRLMFTSLREDFRRAFLKEYFFEKRKIEEIETHLTIDVKSKTGPFLKGTTRERSGLGRLDEKHGGGIIAILMREEAPQPWESNTPSNAPETTAATSPAASVPEQPRAGQD